MNDSFSNDPGTEADAIGFIFDQEDLDELEDTGLTKKYSFAQMEYDSERLGWLEKNQHTQANGNRIRIRKMTDSHLRNSLYFAQRNIDSPYWSKAIIKFKEEMQKRVNNVLS